ncbi:TPA: hypothetical protein IAC10_06675 [Candidatus Scatousia excrementigallinarum]|uniref:Uncharacterized protein n=1 Tax=Candidatus Scatousia excrementigallinarum TaxID=2840935 RepID=A0A9D1EYJ5_9BACT|nr:hypothetical protein [Candidatus Scatousia excrementigallinarum]
MRFECVQYLLDVYRGKRELIDPHKVVNSLTAGNKFVYTQEDANEIVANHILSDKPEMICRFGTLELDTMRMMLNAKGCNPKYNKWHKDLFSNTAGFFPIDDYNMTRFACEQFEILKDVDVLASRPERYERKVVGLYLQHADIVDINAFSYPFCYKNPWSKALEGKKVLVINPFDETIKKQYEKRDKLFKNPDVLPEFELITCIPVQGIGHAKKYLEYKTWFEALAAMKADIKKINFDIAIIGAGAYGMFLAQYVKSLGKKAIHMGGATQLLFGIKGSRWDSWLGKNYYNEYWTRPSKEETPEGVELFEHGTMAYW